MDHANIRNFSDEFSVTRRILKDETFDQSWNELIRGLRVVLNELGPDDSGAPSLDKLRKQTKYGGSYIKSFFAGKPGEDQEILVGTGEYTTSDGAGTNFTGNAKLTDKAAAIKFLRHLYMLRKRGSHKLWVCSLPNSYSRWPHGEMAGCANDFAGLRVKLSDTDERFSEEEKKHLSNATQEALKWSHKVQMLLSNAKAGEDGEGSALVKRWFADENASEEQIDGMISTLRDGFKKITAAVNSNRLIFTDHPVYRGTQFEGSEAFVTAGPKKDALHVVYIENAFFGTNNLLTGLTNWARIVVHELSHSQADTDDVPGKYAWGGIKPNAGNFPSAKAITNADSWAYFAADCNGSLTEKNRSDALRT